MEQLAIACANPFDARAQNAYIPGGSVTKSVKDTAVLKFDGVTDANGNFLLCFNPSPYRDVPCIWYSNNAASTSLSAANPVVDPFLIDGYQTAGTLMYSATDSFQNTGAGALDAYFAGPGVRARVVSAGVKVTFSGSTISDSGTCYALVEPNHENLYGQGIQVMQQYPSCKCQRLTMRGEIEMVMIPTTRDQIEFSPWLDDLTLYTGLGTPVLTDGTSTSGLVHYAYRPNLYTRVQQVSSAGSNVEGANYDLTYSIVDPVLVGRNLSCHYYPLSRKNQISNPWRVDAGLPQTTFSVAAGGVVTFTAHQPPNWASGASVYNGTTWTGYLFLVVSTGVWYLLTQFGRCQSSAISSATYILQLYQVWPSIPAALLITGAAAGQAVHVDYIVHVEYSGVYVAAKSTVNPPDSHAVDVVHAAVNHARDMSGQHEKATLKRVFKGALEHVGTTTAKTAIDGTIAAVLGGDIANSMAPFVSLGVESVAKRMRNW